LALASLHESFTHPAFQVFDRPAMHGGRQLKANLNGVTDFERRHRSFQDFKKRLKPNLMEFPNPAANRLRR
jgi:hypothetical protein